MPSSRERDFRRCQREAAEADFDVMTASRTTPARPMIKLADFVADRFGRSASRYRRRCRRAAAWPGERRLDISQARRSEARVDEEKIRGDRGPICRASCRPCAYSPAGDVAEIIYVNFGIPADYDARAARHRREREDRAGALRRQLARHRPKVAAEHGAVAA
jgi:hypothetical protein